ncbi:unnamed protein product [Cylindrotheca closterium]|uniref:SnoaL-like domain-containing protein n=1 Tax=Cylindrotheca closterium TaxID=2856 RepID=A0AAD2PU63_9STRA|nr:unnamed protein product [Cylindrotheca closterium]
MHVRTFLLVVLALCVFPIITTHAFIPSHPNTLQQQQPQQQQSAFRITRRSDVASSSSSSAAAAAAASDQRRRRFSSVAYPNSSNNANSSPARTATRLYAYSLNSIEQVCVNKMDKWYSKSLAIKCPFLRRRMSDVLDAMDKVMRFLIIRHKSLDLIGPPLSYRCPKMSKAKVRNLNIQQLADVIRKDWREDTLKGYYITGKLNTTVYRDDCLFDGPDPDMPVRGLRKYINAASQLFEHQTSTATLQSLEIVDNHTIRVFWELKATLHLPWHPKLPVWTGSTTYHIDEDGLVYFHEDSWDMSVFQAFTETFFPTVASRIWEPLPTTERPQSSL